MYALRFWWSHLVDLVFFCCVLSLVIITRRSEQTVVPHKGPVLSTMHFNIAHTHLEAVRRRTPSAWVLWRVLLASHLVWPVIKTPSMQIQTDPSAETRLVSNSVFWSVYRNKPSVLNPSCGQCKCKCVQTYLILYRSCVFVLFISFYFSPQVLVTAPHNCCPFPSVK